MRERLAVLNPPPLRKMPIMVGGGGEKVTLRITAEHADIWHGFGDADVMRHKNSVLDGWCRKRGRDPAEIERSSGIPLVNRDDATYAEALLAEGITLFSLSINGPDYDLSFLDRFVAWRDEKNAE